MAKPLSHVLSPLMGAVGFLVCLPLGAQHPGHLDPAEATFAGAPGDCFDEHKVAELRPPLPPTDVLLLVDLTGSMGQERENLILHMADIIAALPPLVGDVAFGVAWLQDHPVRGDSCAYFNDYGFTSDLPYVLHQPVTTTSSVLLASLASLPPALSGGDFPESYASALQSVLVDAAIGWRPASRRLVMLFGDDMPHDCELGACLGASLPSTGPNPGPDAIIGTADDLSMMEIMDLYSAARIPLLVVESSETAFGAVSYESIWRCWAQRSEGAVVAIQRDGAGTSGETLADLIVDLLEDSLDRCPIVQLVAQPGFEEWLAWSTPVYTDVGAPATLEFDLRICIPPGASPGTHSFTVNLDCLGGTNAQQRVTIDVGGCACAAPVLAPGFLDTCFPDPESARLAALAATSIQSTCSGDAVLTASVSGGCDAIVTVASEHPCGDDSLEYAVRIDPAAPSLSGVPPPQSASCAAVPGPPVVAASDDCDGSVPVDHAEVRIDGPCPDTYELVRTWTATDACGNVEAATRTVHVSDDQPPVLSGIPADATVECDAVPLPASPSASDDCDPAPAIAFVETRTDGPCPGRWDLLRAWTATDRCGNAATGQQLVTVQDTTPPIIDPSVTTTHCFWPPRHRPNVLDQSDFSPSIEDACSGPVTWVFADCASDQPDDGLGDGSTTGDCTVASDGRSIAVRSERQGGRQEGRTYSVAAIATDACGNSSAPVIIGHVHVPHDQSEHPPCARSR